MTTVLTVAALDYGLDKRINYMARVCRRFAVTGGRTQIQVPIASTLDPSGEGSIRTDAIALNQYILNTAGEKIVFGYSRGCQVAGEWMRLYANNIRAPHPSELSFVLIGNPERGQGHPPWVKKTTPTTTQYTVWDVCRRDDGWANWNGKARNVIGMLGAAHMKYWNTDLYGPDNQIVGVAGATSYVVAP